MNQLDVDVFTFWLLKSDTNPFLTCKTLKKHLRALLRSTLCIIFLDRAWRNPLAHWEC